MSLPKRRFHYKSHAYYHTQLSEMIKYPQGTQEYLKKVLIYYPKSFIATSLISTEIQKIQRFQKTSRHYVPDQNKLACLIDLYSSQSFYPFTRAFTLPIIQHWNPIYPTSSTEHQNLWVASDQKEEPVAYTYHRSFHSLVIITKDFWEQTNVCVNSIATVWKNRSEMSWNI